MTGMKRNAGWERKGPASTGGVVSSPDLGAYLERPLTAPDDEALAAAAAGPCDPATALALGQVERLLDPEPLAVETGWWLLGDETFFGYCADFAKRCNARHGRGTSAFAAGP